MDIIYTNDAEYSDYLEHHGIQGQKWGVRRYQNPDGTLTEAGQKRYNKQVSQVEKRYDPYTKKSLLTVSRNASALNKTVRDYEHSVRKLSKLESNGADMSKVNKARKKTKEKYAKVEEEKALQNAMKRMEMENIEKGTYAHNKRVNVGRDAVKKIEAYMLAIGMSTITGGIGIGVVSRDRREGTSLTKDQYKKAVTEARSVYENTLRS